MRWLLGAVLILVIPLGTACEARLPELTAPWMTNAFSGRPVRLDEDRFVLIDGQRTLTLDFRDEAPPWVEADEWFDDDQWVWPYRNNTDIYLLRSIPHVSDGAESLHRSGLDAFAPERVFDLDDVGLHGAFLGGVTTERLFFGLQNELVVTNLTGDTLGRIDLGDTVEFVFPGPADLVIVPSLRGALLVDTSDPSQLVVRSILGRTRPTTVLWQDAQTAWVGFNGEVVRHDLANPDAPTSALPWLQGNGPLSIVDDVLFTSSFIYDISDEPVAVAITDVEGSYHATFGFRSGWLFFGAIGSMYSE